jgi:hypothetical protein
VEGNITASVNERKRGKKKQTSAVDVSLSVGVSHSVSVLSTLIDYSCPPTVTCTR